MSDQEIIELIQSISRSMEEMRQDIRVIKKAVVPEVDHPDPEWKLCPKCGWSYNPGFEHLCR